MCSAWASSRAHRRRYIGRLDDPAPRGLHLGEPRLDLCVEAVVRDGQPGHRASARDQGRVAGGGAMNDHGGGFGEVVQGHDGPPDPGSVRDRPPVAVDVAAGRTAVGQLCGLVADGPAKYLRWLGDSLG